MLFFCYELIAYSTNICSSFEPLTSPFRCADGDFYVALGSSMSLALLVWVGGGLLKLVLYFFGNETSLGLKSPNLHLTQRVLIGLKVF